MKALKFIRYDFVEGTIRNWYKFLMAVLISCVMVNLFDFRIEGMLNNGYIYTKGTVLDYIMYSMAGMGVYKFNPHDMFRVPIEWFIINIWIAYIIAYYPENNLKNSGRNLFIASKSRTWWWLSKCIWCVFNIIIYYLVFFGSTIMFSYFCGAEISFAFSEDIMVSFYGDALSYVFNNDIIFLVFILPCITTVAISLVQMLLSFFVTPVMSFASVCGLYVISAYYTHPLIVGSFTMWQRSSYLDVDGVNPHVGIIIALLMIISSILAGCIKFDRKDIF